MNLDEFRSSLNIEEAIIPAGRHNRPGTLIAPTFVTIHNTDNKNPGADARSHGRFLIKTGYYEMNGTKHVVSWHYSVDDIRAVQHLPLHELGYHAKKGNMLSIGVEICMHAGIDQQKAFASAARLTAYLLHTIPSLKRDIAKVVSHKFWTGKDCPSLLLNSWPSFMNMVRQAYDSVSSEAAFLESMPQADDGNETYEINPVIESDDFHLDEDAGPDDLGKKSLDHHHHNLTITNELIAEVDGADRVEGKIAAISALESMERDNNWDLAHEVKDQINGVAFAEPNVDNVYVFENTAFPPASEENYLESPTDRCQISNDFETHWPFPKDGSGNTLKSIWHLGDQFSQLATARNSLSENMHIVRIAHLDTGYDPDHAVYQDKLIRHDLERNFVEDENPGSAVDNFSTGILKNPGHGTGTLSILAGKKIKIPQYNFDDAIGMHSAIEIVPLRIAKSVVLFKSANFVKAVRYVISLYDNPDTRCHVITMSMGGLASKAWADVVNEAYEKGIFIVTAAGNNFLGMPTRTLVFPARFNRVVAACGVTFDYTPYYKKNASVKIMQGNFGPRKFMRTAIAAFTPNMPWAKIGCNPIVSLAGAGTSSATPQIAAAAALYYKKYYSKLESLDAGWKKVETIRQALFLSAGKKIKGHENDVELYFGAGVLQAARMLDISPEQIHLREEMKEERDRISFPLLSLLSGFGLESALESLDEQKQEMLQTEIVQLIQQSKELQGLLDDEETEVEALNDAQKKAFREKILSMNEASKTLKSFLKDNTSH